MSAMNFQEADVRMFVVAGADAVFPKPVQADEILAELLRKVHHRWRSKHGLANVGR